MILFLLVETWIDVEYLQMVLEAYVKAFVTREIETKAYNGKAIKWSSSLLMRSKINIGVL